jgi:hypothetical protein
MIAHQRPLELAIADTARFLAGLHDRLPMFVVCDHPTDFPDFYVARLHLTLPEDEVQPFAIMERELSKLHAIMEALGLHKLMPAPEDDPVILETWL